MSVTVAREKRQTTSPAAWVDAESTTRVSWENVNQDRRLNIGRLNMGEAVYTLLDSIWPYEDQRSSEIIPINHVLRFEVTDAAMEMETPLDRRAKLRLVTQRESDGSIRRAHVHSICEILDGDGRPTCQGDYWIAITKPFAPKGQRRLEEIPRSLRVLEEHPLADTDPPARSLAGYVQQNADAEHLRRTTFHVNQTDINRHLNTMIYLSLIQSLTADFGSVEGWPVADMRFRGLQILFRKPFGPGDVCEMAVGLKRSNSGFESVVRFFHVVDGETADTPSTAALVWGDC